MAWQWNQEIVASVGNTPRLESNPGSNTYAVPVANLDKILQQSDNKELRDVLSNLRLAPRVLTEAEFSQKRNSWPSQFQSLSYAEYLNKSQEFVEDLKAGLKNGLSISYQEMVLFTEHSKLGGVAYSREGWDTIAGAKKDGNPDDDDKLDLAEAHANAQWVATIENRLGDGSYTLAKNYVMVREQDIDNQIKEIEKEKGVVKSEDLIRIARARVREAGIANVTFIENAAPGSQDDLWNRRIAYYVIGRSFGESAIQPVDNARVFKYTTINDNIKTLLAGGTVQTRQADPVVTGPRMSVEEYNQKIQKLNQLLQALNIRELQSADLPKAKAIAGKVDEIVSLVDELKARAPETVTTAGLENLNQIKANAFLDMVAFTKIRLAIAQQSPAATVDDKKKRDELLNADQGLPGLVKTYSQKGVGFGKQISNSTDSQTREASFKLLALEEGVSIEEKIRRIEEYRQFVEGSEGKSLKWVGLTLGIAQSCEIWLSENTESSNFETIRQKALDNYRLALENLTDETQKKEIKQQIARLENAAYYKKYLQVVSLKSKVAEFEDEGGNPIPGKANQRYGENLRQLLTRYKELLASNPPDFDKEHLQNRVKETQEKLNEASFYYLAQRGSLITDNKGNKTFGPLPGAPQVLQAGTHRPGRIKSVQANYVEVEILMQNNTTAVYRFRKDQLKPIWSTAAADSKPAESTSDVREHPSTVSAESKYWVYDDNKPGTVVPIEIAESDVRAIIAEHNANLNTNLFQNGRVGLKASAEVEGVSGKKTLWLSLAEYQRLGGQMPQRRQVARTETAPRREAPRREVRQPRREPPKRETVRREQPVTADPNRAKVNEIKTKLRATPQAQIPQAYRQIAGQYGVALLKQAVNELKSGR